MRPRSAEIWAAVSKMPVLSVPPAVGPCAILVSYQQTEEAP